MAHARTCQLPLSRSLSGSLCCGADYDCGPGTPFLGPYAETRATRDHAYHGRYTVARQRWQDGALEGVVQRSEPQPAPWLVFTCGGMGVGKGYALGWMSEQGIFPLEDIVHIDPDHFKSVLPEWHSYVAYANRLNDPAIAGNRCHKESCYLQARRARTSLLRLSLARSLPLSDSLALSLF